MWFLPTRNRQKAVRQLILAMEGTGEVPEVAVMVDGPKYQDFEWPSNWHIHQSAEHLEMGWALNELFKLYPNEKTYGILTDSHRPLTANWASKMEAIAEQGLIANSNENRERMNPVTLRKRLATICFPGDLIRALGWICLPKLVHLYADDVWEDIGYGLNIVRHLPDVIILALLKREGEVEIDENHKRIWRGRPYLQHDMLAYYKWRREEMPNLLEYLKESRCEQSCAS